MPRSSKRFFTITGLILLLLAVLVVIAGYIATGKIEQRISQELAKFGIHTRSATVSLLNRSVTLDSVTLNLGFESSHALEIGQVKVDGFHILKFVQSKKIIVNDITVSNGLIHYNKDLGLQKLQRGEKQKQKLAGIQVGHLAVKAIAFQILKDTVVESSGFLNDLELTDIAVLFGADTAYSIGSVEVVAEKLRQSKAGALHTFAVSRIEYNSREQRLEADSFRIIPNYDKPEFARVAKIQKTRLEITLPKTICEGIDDNRFFIDSTLVITKITIPNPVVHAYRNKRYPFVRDWIMPLPIEGIRRLPFRLKVDSILISQAEIEYEEFSEKGLEATGTISFNKLDASFAGLNTRLENPGRKAFCTLVADCKIMNSGILHATFKMPLNSKVNYEAFGNVRNMDLKSLNPHLGNLSRIEIGDGTLNDLRFNFSYNDNVSTGEVLVNYTGLKVQALKKDKGHEINKVLTTAINAVIKSDKDKSVDKSKRTGAINIQRDKKRFVFQLWWKSLLDGLQSTFLPAPAVKATKKRQSRKK